MSSLNSAAEESAQLNSGIEMGNWFKKNTYGFAKFLVQRITEGVI